MRHAFQRGTAPHPIFLNFLIFFHGNASFKDGLSRCGRLRLPVLELFSRASLFAEPLVMLLVGFQVQIISGGIMSDILLEILEAYIRRPEPQQKEGRGEAPEDS